MARLLLIEDDDDYGLILQEILQEQGHQVARAETAKEGLDLLSKGTIDLVLLDYWLPAGMSGLECLKVLQEQNLQIPRILLTGLGDPDVAIEAFKLGVLFYLEKPFGIDQSYDELLARVREALEMARMRPVAPPNQTNTRRGDGTELIGKSEQMKEVYERIGRVVDSKTAVLILGETGTGKELVARAIFQHDSRRKDKPFVAVNCKAIPDTLLESELFGHERSAFAGADRRHIGKFEQANGGTILLDEIGNMNLDAQEKILRVLQEGELHRVSGEGEAVKVDVRVIACTNQDLEAAINAGKFRADLYYRLNGVTIDLPPLRERHDNMQDDILLLADHFLDRAAASMGRPRKSLHERARAKLQKYCWPGNVRELQQVVVRAFLICRGAQIMPEDLEVDVPTETAKDDTVASLQQAIRLAWNSHDIDLWPILHDLLERELLRYARTELKGNKTQMPKRLKMATNTIRARLRKHGLK